MRASEGTANRSRASDQPRGTSVTRGCAERASSSLCIRRPCPTSPISRLNSDSRHNSLWLPSRSVDIRRSGTICVGRKAWVHSAPGSESPLKSAQEAANDRFRLDLLLDVNRHSVDHQVFGVLLVLAAKRAGGRGRCCACSESSSAPARPPTRGFRAPRSGCSSIRPRGA